jgi:hypothetical protein
MGGLKLQDSFPHFVIDTREGLISRQPREAVVAPPIETPLVPSLNVARKLFFVDDPGVSVVIFQLRSSRSERFKGMPVIFVGKLDAPVIPAI